MRRFSLKLKLTIVYTFFMVLVTCIALAILFSLSTQEVLSSAKMQLKNQVQNSVKEIEEEDGDLEVDSDFYNLEDNIYLSLYSSSGSFLYGKIPYGFNAQPDFQDGNLRTIRENNEQWYVLDLSFPIEDYGTVFIRGITSVTKAEYGFLITLRFAMIVLPLLVILTAVIGYIFTSHTLKPVRRITETVKEIYTDEDLSRRVDIGNGKDEIYHLADTFDHLLDRLEASFQREKQFTSDVSHELRTPVTVILTQCDALLHDSTLTEEQKIQIRLIERKSQNMAQMISQLLLLSRADQGRQKLTLEHLNISELTEMTAEEQQILADEKQILIHQEIEPDIYADIDETFFIRMLTNLISNAICYGKTGGTIFVRLSRQANFIIGSVEDNGIGISPEDQPHIWERFYRADAARTDSGHSGLGLAMTKWIAEAHGGSISVESQLGKGSIFTFLLPVSAQSPLL